MRVRPHPAVIIVGLTLLYFHDLVLHPGGILYSDCSDLVVQHVPNKQFLVHQWQMTGELPLWCPYSFGGNPFVHDPQLGALYPLHWPLYLMPPNWMGTALSWLVVLHVMLAGWAMYAYARSLRLEPFASLVAAVGFMFAGKWLLHIVIPGHIIVGPLAWLPFVLLGLERAIRGDGRSPLLAATWAGVAFALLTLGTHPQWTFYAGLFTAFWALGAVSERVNDQREQGLGPAKQLIGRALGRWAGFGAWVALIAVGLSAAQLLLTLDIAAESTRGVGVDNWELTASIWPTLFGMFGVGPSLPHVDLRGGLGALWFGVACLAAVLGRSGAAPRITASFAILGLLLAYSLGGFLLLQALPGFRFFQLPVRMLILVPLPVAVLAGYATQALFTSEIAPERRVAGQRLLIAVAVIAVLLAAQMEQLEYRAWAEGETKQGRSTEVAAWLERFRPLDWLYWATLPLTVVVAAWIVRRPTPLRAWVWLAVLLVDAWALTGPFVQARSESDLYVPSACVETLKERQRDIAEREHDRLRVLDRGLPLDPSSGPLGIALPAMPHVEIEPVLGFAPLEVRRYKEYLQFLTDRDDPIRPRQTVFGFPLVNAFPIENKSLLDLLGVRYLIEPTDPNLRPDGAAEPARNSRWRKVCAEERPRVYGLHSGLHDLPPHTVYENLDAFPRAFVVPEAQPLPARGQVLATLKSADLRRVVYLEDWQPAPDASPSAGSFRAARIREYQPNRVIVDVPDGPAGYLVLTDVYFPGWSCTVDGRPSQIYRADYLFRGVELPAGAHEVVFRFAPASFYWGKRISGATAALVVVVSLLCLLLRTRNPAGGVQGA